MINLANLQQFQAINVLVDPGAIGGPKVVPLAIEVKVSFALSTGKSAHMILAGGHTGSFVPSVAHANSIMTGLSTGAAWTALAGFLGNDMAIFSVTLRDMSAQGLEEFVSTAAQAAGTSTGVAMPFEIALALTFRTTLRGPGHRGRAYIPGWATNALGATNLVAAAAVTAAQNWGLTFASVFAAEGLTHVLALPARSAYTGSTGTSHPARTAHTELVTAVLVRDNHWDSQRRRGLK